MGRRALMGKQFKHKMVILLFGKVNGPTGNGREIRQFCDNVWAWC